MTHTYRRLYQDLKDPVPISLHISRLYNVPRHHTDDISFVLDRLRVGKIRLGQADLLHAVEVREVLYITFFKKNPKFIYIYIYL